MLGCVRCSGDLCQLCLVSIWEGFICSCEELLFCSLCESFLGREQRTLALAFSWDSGTVTLCAYSHGTLLPHLAQQGLEKSIVSSASKPVHRKSHKSFVRELCSE